MAELNSEEVTPDRAVTSGPEPNRRQRELRVTVAHRAQTREEERQFGEAVKVFLAEVVRQHMRHKSHDRQTQ